MTSNWAEKTHVQLNLVITILEITLHLESTWGSLMMLHWRCQLKSLIIIINLVITMYLVLNEVYHNYEISPFRWFHRGFTKETLRKMSRIGSNKLLLVSRLLLCRFQKLKHKYEAVIIIHLVHFVWFPTKERPLRKVSKPQLKRLSLLT